MDWRRANQAEVDSLLHLVKTEVKGGTLTYVFEKCVVQFLGYSSFGHLIESPESVRFTMSIDQDHPDHKLLGEYLHYAVRQVYEGTKGLNPMRMNESGVWEIGIDEVVVENHDMPDQPCGNFKDGNPGWFSDQAWEALKPWHGYIENSLWQFGPGHIVFADPNTDNSAIDFCLRACYEVDRYRELMGEDNLWDGTGEGVLIVQLGEIAKALLALKRVPEHNREVPYGSSCYE